MGEPGLPGLKGLPGDSGLCKTDAEKYFSESETLYLISLLIVKWVPQDSRVKLGKQLIR